MLSVASGAVDVQGGRVTGNTYQRATNKETTDNGTNGVACVDQANFVTIPIL